MRKKIATEFIRRTITDWGKVLVLLLDEAAVLVVVILVLKFLGIRIPLPVTIPIVIMGGIFVFIIHIAVIPSFRRKIVTGREGMIGVQGRVVEPLTPIGVIFVKGEYWNAKSVDDNIEVDENVEIVGLDRLTLKVQRKGS